MRHAERLRWVVYYRKALGQFIERLQFIEVRVYRTTVHWTTVHRTTVYRTESLSKRPIWHNCRKTILRHGHHAAMHSCSHNCLLNFIQVQSPLLSFFGIDL